MRPNLPPTSDVDFNLPWIKKDCAEQAIVSTGRPKLTCELTGYDIGMAFLPPKKRSSLATGGDTFLLLEALDKHELTISDSPSSPSWSPYICVSADLFARVVGLW